MLERQQQLSPLSAAPQESRESLFCSFKGTTVLSDRRGGLESKDPGVQGPHTKPVERGEFKTQRIRESQKDRIPECPGLKGTL